jgi:uncharacterized protein YjeT (DUF2065 family)
MIQILFTVSKSMYIALALTLLIEITIFLILKYRSYKFLMLFIITNIVTNLSMNYLLKFMPITRYDFSLYGMEIFVFIIEGLIYILYLKEFKKAMILSFIANFSSLFLGLFIMQFIH